MEVGLEVELVERDCGDDYAGCEAYCDGQSDLPGARAAILDRVDEAADSDDGKA
jgi:hypothetical protein